MCKIRTEENLKLGRNQVMLVTGLITEHGRIGKHLHSAGLLIGATASHILFHCLTIAILRYEVFGTLQEIHISTKTCKILDLVRMGEFIFLDYQGDGTISLLSAVPCENRPGPCPNNNENTIKKSGVRKIYFFYFCRI